MGGILMALDPNTPRSRRALLAAAAGGAAAVAASAAAPATALALPTAVLTETANTSGADTSVTDTGADSTAFTANATGTGNGFGLAGTSLAAAGLFAWSVSHPSTYWTDPLFDPAFTSYTGVFGSSPAGDGVTTLGTGVWGDSPDVGVLGTGGVGVRGEGFFGMVAAGAIGGGTGLRTWGGNGSGSDIALDVRGKALFSRSGRTTISAGQSTKKINLTGVTWSSLVFAVLRSNRSGRYVRAVVPTTGSFTIYLNTAVTSSTYVVWFVLN
jgi:hypothetical protein